MKTGSLSVAGRVFVSFIAIGLIAYVLRDKLDESIHILKTEVNWPWFFFAVFIFSVSLVILAVRLFYVFRVQEIIISFKESLYLGFVGLFFNLFFPSAVGGDVAKAYYAYKHSGKKIAATTAVLLDRLMGFVALILMAIIALFFYSKQLNDPRIDHFIYLFLGIMLFTMLFFASKRFARLFQFLLILIPSPKWRERMSDVYHAIYQYKSHRGILLLCLFLSFVAQVFFVWVHYCLAVSLGTNYSPWVFFIFVPIITIISMAPSLSGLGVREAGAIYLFSRIMPSERALALSLLLDMLTYGFSFSSGILYALRGGLKKKLIHEMEELK